jgi:hypothetical protein
MMPIALAAPANGRGVSRVYEMSLEDDVWSVWRNAPGYWEMSRDGETWRRDFGLVYANVT